MHFEWVKLKNNICRWKMKDEFPMQTFRPYEAMQIQPSEGKLFVIIFFSNWSLSSEYNCKIKIYIFLTEKIIYIPQGKWLHSMKILGHIFKQ